MSHLPLNSGSMTLPPSPPPFIYSNNTISTNGGGSLICAECRNRESNFEKLMGKEEFKVLVINSL